MITNSTIRHLQLTFCILFGLIISACSPIIKYEQPSTIELIKLPTEETIGQTFLSRYRGLNGVEIFIQPETITKGKLFLYLYHNPMDTSKEIDVSSLPLENVSEPGYYRIPITTVKDSFNKDYYFQVEIEGQNELDLAFAPGNYYLNGALYHNGISQDSQLSFRLTYDPIQLYIGVLLEILNWIFIIFIACWLYIIPGWAILGLTVPRWSSLRVLVKFALSAGVSLAIYPIVLLWTHLIGLRLGPLYAWLPPILGSGYLFWYNRQTLVKFNTPKTLHSLLESIKLKTFTYIKSPTIWLPNFILLIILLLIFASRFWVIRNLDAPMWGDSYQHTMISQLLVDNDGLFDNWMPYADLTTFTYHFGFHSLVAVFHWITKLSLPQATLWVGQILNVIAVLCLYPLALQIGRTRWSGVFTVLIAGLLLSMPMFYVNWGRYTQLTGNILLASFASLAWMTIGTKISRFRVGILLGVILSGLALTHYRMLILTILFIPVFLIIYGREYGWKSIIINSLISGIVGAFIFLPWFLHVFTGRIIQIFSNQITKLPNASAGPQLQTNIFGNLYDYLPPYIWLLLPIVICIGLWKRDKGVAIITLWWYLIILITNPQWLGLPGAAIITNFAVLIAAYIPASFLFGYAGGKLLLLINKTMYVERLESLSYPFAPLYVFSLIIIILILGLWGARQRLKDVQPSKHALVTRPDIRASNWIQANSQENERFLVNSFFAFNDTVVVGSDAGWWLPLLARQATTLPPINYAFEEGSKQDYHEQINSLTSIIQTKGINHPDVLAEFDARGVTNIYLGQQGGSVNYPGSHVINYVDLLTSPYYQPIYHQDRVWIFSIVR